MGIFEFEEFDEYNEENQVIFTNKKKPKVNIKDILKNIK